MPKNWKGGPFGIFQHPFWRKTAKNEGGPFEEIFFKKKSRSAEKNERGDPLVSTGMVCYAEKQEKPFWFSSLGQIVQFGAIIFCRTFRNYFGQFVWIEKVTTIVAFHFMKRRLKIRLAKAEGRPFTGKRDKTADFQNGTKQPISKRVKTANF